MIASRAYRLSFSPYPERPAVRQSPLTFENATFSESRDQCGVGSGPTDLAPPVPGPVRLLLAPELPGAVLAVVVPAARVVVDPAANVAVVHRARWRVASLAEEQRKWRLEPPSALSGKFL